MRWFTGFVVGVLVWSTTGCGDNAMRRESESAPDPVDLRHLVDGGSESLVRRALKDERSSYPVRLEALRQARRLRDSALAPEVLARVEGSRDAFEHAVAVDVLFGIAPEVAKAEANAFDERCASDTAAQAALAGAI